MTDDIFDYFGGNSPRKVEPLDQDELFEDLMPKPVDEPAAELQPETERDSGKTAKLSVSKPTSATGPVDDENTAGDSDTGSDSTDEQIVPPSSHWDSLASSLGIAPPPPKAREKKPEISSGSPSSPAVEAEPKRPAKSRKAKDTRDSKKPAPAERKKGRRRSETPKPAIASQEIVEDVEIVSTGANPKSEPASTSDDFFGFDSPQQPKEIAAEEVLSELFVSGESESPDDSYSSRESVDAFPDDDPFAAFHGSGHRDEKDDSLDDADKPQLSSDDDENDEDEQSSLIVSEDFVEFEVKDLVRKRDSDRAPRGKRQRRAKTDGPRQQQRDSQDRDVEKKDDSDEPRSRRRRGRGKSRSRSESSFNERERSEEVARPVVEDTRDDSTDDDSRRRRPKTRRNRPERSDRDRTPSLDQDDDHSDKKKPRIPTWEDAICGVVEENIKRHKSGSNRGGKRRRN